MKFFSSEQRLRLIVNGRIVDMDDLLMRPPVAKLFTPDAGGTWLLSALDKENLDLAWGLCDPGLGSPEIGWVSLSDLAKVRGRFGMGVRRDDAFRPNATLGAYADEARRTGVIIA